MFPLFETIKVLHKKVYHFHAHFIRMQNSIKKLSGKDLQFYLDEKIILTLIKDEQLYKCRILYNENDFQIEITPYQKRNIEKIIFIDDETIFYPIKFTDRTCFLKHTQHLHNTTEPLFVINGMLTDSSFSNIALWNGSEWHTPKLPLFDGIKRNCLIHEKKIVEKNISQNDVVNYQKISFINAMLDLGELEITKH